MRSLPWRIRIGWASYKSKKEPKTLLHHDRIESSSVHVSYISYQLKNLITEESLRILFSQYGVVLDTSIKKSYIDEVREMRTKQRLLLLLLPFLPPLHISGGPLLTCRRLSLLVSVYRASTDSAAMALCTSPARRKASKVHWPPSPA